MTELTISIRRARSRGRAALSGVFDDAWREAYQGIIPARARAHDGPARPALVALDHRPRPPLVVLDVGERWPATSPTAVAATARCPPTARSTSSTSPRYQGLGFGTRLFKAVRTHGTAA